MCVDVLGCQAAPMSEWRPRTPASPCCRLAHLARFWHGQRSRTTGRSRLDSWFGGLGDRLVAVDVEARVAYVAREDVDALEATHPSEAVRFLPGHDQWVMGPGTKDANVTASTRRVLMTRKANPVIAGGVVRGTWARTATR